MHKSSFKKFFLLASLCFSTAILNSCSDIDTQDTTSITIDIPTKALSSARDVVLREDDNLIIDDAPGISIQELQSKCRKYKMEHNLHIIMIDYLQLMSGSGKRSAESRQQEVSEISRALKALARELNVPVC